MSYDTKCQYCGAECYYDEMHNGWKCKSCHVQDCSHTDTYKELGNYKIQTSVEILESCLKCKCFRSITLYYTGNNVISAKWDHDEVHLDQD
jgi:reverse gyrase